MSGLKDMLGGLLSLLMKPCLKVGATVPAALKSSNFAQIERSNMQRKFHIKDDADTMRTGI